MADSTEDGGLSPATLVGCIQPCRDDTSPHEHQVNRAGSRAWVVFFWALSRGLRAASCLSTTPDSCPLFIRSLSSLVLRRTPTFPFRPSIWHICQRDPVGMARLGARGLPLCTKGAGSERRAVVRVLARRTRAGSSPHAHRDLAIYADGHGQACCCWRRAHLAGSFAWVPSSTHTPGSLSQSLVPGPSAGQPQEASSHRPGSPQVLRHRRPHVMVLSPRPLRLG